MKEELQKFIALAEATKLGYTGEKITGITLDDFERVGISDKTVTWLQKNHYISINKNKPIWISWTNKYYPSKTIEGLKNLLKK